jgi:hypothetical protein
VPLQVEGVAMKRWWLAALALVVGVSAYSAPLPGPKWAQKRSLESELALPPLGIVSPAGPIKFDLKGTPADKYDDKGKPQEAVRKAVHEARILLWASSPAEAPRDIQAEVAVLRKGLVAPARGVRPVRPIKGAKGPPHLLQISCRAPANAGQERFLKEQVFATSREVARLISRLEDVAERLDELAASSEKECPRWQAHRALVVAAVRLRTIHLNEYSLALGDMRRELPDRQPKHIGWRLMPEERPRDVVSKKLYRAASKELVEISKKYHGTAWDQLAQGLRAVPLSVSWKPE